MHNIQLVNNVFFKQFAFSVFRVCSFVKNLSFLLCIASDTEQSKNVMHSLAAIGPQSFSGVDGEIITIHL